MRILVLFILIMATTSGFSQSEKGNTKYEIGLGIWVSQSIFEKNFEKNPETLSRSKRINGS